MDFSHSVTIYSGVVYISFEPRSYIENDIVLIESDLEVFIYSIDSFRDRNFLANNGKTVNPKKLLVT